LNFHGIPRHSAVRPGIRSKTEQSGAPRRFHDSYYKATVQLFVSEPFRTVPNLTEAIRTQPNHDFSRRSQSNLIEVNFIRRAEIVGPNRTQSDPIGPNRT